MSSAVSRVDIDDAEITDPITIVGLSVVALLGLLAWWQTRQFAALTTSAVDPDVWTTMRWLGALSPFFAALAFAVGGANRIVGSVGLLMTVVLLTVEVRRLRREPPDH